MDYGDTVIFHFQGEEAHRAILVEKRYTYGRRRPSIHVENFNVTPMNTQYIFFNPLLNIRFRVGHSNIPEARTAKCVLTEQTCKWFK